MAYTTPFTAVTGGTITSSGHNTSIRDNLEYLKGRAGAVTIESGINAQGPIASLTAGVSTVNGTLTSTTSGTPPASLIATLQRTAGDTTQIGYQLAPAAGNGWQFGMLASSSNAFIAQVGLDYPMTFEAGAGGRVVLARDTEVIGRRLTVDKNAAGGATAYANATVCLQTESVGAAVPTSLGFSRVGLSGIAVYHNGPGSNTLRIVDHLGVDKNVWTGIYQGTGTTMDADMVDGAHAGNASGNVALANGTVVSNLNANLVNGVAPGNSNGNIALSNGIMCTNLVAERAVKLSIIGVADYIPGNANGNVPISNGIVNTNLNADLLDGLSSAAFAQVANNTEFASTVAAQRFTIGSLSGSEFIQAPAGGEVGIWTSGAGTNPRYRQSSSSAIFNTPGTYVTSWVPVSDGRLKTDVEAIDSALDRIRRLRPMTYVPSSDGIALGMVEGERRPGFIAQELGGVFPDLVGERPSEDEDGEPYLTADYIGLGVYLARAIAELADALDAIHARLAT